MHRLRNLLVAALVVFLVHGTGPGLARSAPAAATGGESAAEGTAAGAESAASDSLGGAGDLGPSTAVPWNPPRRVPRAEGWETAIRFPFRVATIGLSGLGYVTKKTLVFAEENQLAARALVLLSPLPALGVTIGPASLGDRTGLGGALRIEPPVLGHFLEAELQGSTDKYSRVRVGLHRGFAGLSYSYEWRPRDRFFGIGQRGFDDQAASTYSHRTQHVTLSLDYPIEKLDQAPPRGQLGLWAGPRERILHNGREAPSFDVRFPELAGLLDDRHEHFVYGLGASWDARSGIPHWSRGFMVAVRAERFDKAIEAFTIRDARTDASQFTRIGFSGEAGVSFMRDPRTVRVSIEAVTQRTGGNPNPLLLPDLVSLGGHEGLAGFEPGRFHDRDKVVAKLSYIFPIARHVEFEMHAETGGVFPELEKARLDTFRNSYGVAVRPRMDTAPLGSVGVDWSSETVRLRFSIGGVE